MVTHKPLQNWHLLLAFAAWCSGASGQGLFGSVSDPHQFNAIHVTLADKSIEWVSSVLVSTAVFLLMGAEYAQQCLACFAGIRHCRSLLCRFGTLSGASYKTLRTCGLTRDFRNMHVLDRHIALSAPLAGSQSTDTVLSGTSRAAPDAQLVNISWLAGAARRRTPTSQLAATRP